jgi:hypothetical protein
MDAVARIIRAAVPWIATGLVLSLVASIVSIIRYRAAYKTVVSQSGLVWSGLVWSHPVPGLSLSLDTRSPLAERRFEIPPVQHVVRDDSRARGALQDQSPGCASHDDHDPPVSQVPAGRSVLL